MRIEKGVKQVFVRWKNLEKPFGYLWITLQSTPETDSDC